VDRPSLEMVEVQKIDEILLTEFFCLRVYAQGNLYPTLVLLFFSATPKGSLSRYWGKETFHPTWLSPVQRTLRLKRYKVDFDSWILQLF